MNDAIEKAIENLMAQQRKLETATAEIIVTLRASAEHLANGDREEAQRLLDLADEQERALRATVVGAPASSRRAARKRRPTAGSDAPTAALPASVAAGA